MRNAYVIPVQQQKTSEELGFSFTSFPDATVTDLTAKFLEKPHCDTVPITFATLSRFIVFFLFDESYFYIL
jgi:hypothetical protein